MAWLTALLTLPFRLATDLFRRFLALSLPARIAWSVGVVQLLLCVLTLVFVLVGGGRLTFQAWWTPGKGMLLLLLLVLVPVFVYYAMRLWLHEEVSRWRDIEQAWRESLAELSRQQVDLRNAPLFIVLGTDGRDEERALMQMAPVPFVVVSAPPGSAPLHVYAGHDAIFVCLSAIGQTCTVAAAARRGAAATAAPTARPTGLSAGERAEAYDRITALCERIVAARRPLAPVNGIAVVAPVELGADDQARTAGLAAAAAEDLQQLTGAFGLRAPIVLGCTLPGGTPGFKELGSLLPAADRARTVGQAFPLGTPSGPPEIEAVALNAGGRLFDVIGDLLSDPKATERPELNRSLLRLLCVLRTAGVDSITRLMQRAFDFAAAGAAPLFAGCYVLVLPERGEGGLFGRGLFERMLACQGDLDWTATRLRQDRFQRLLSTGLVATAAAMVTATVALTLWRIFR
ncbi:MAG: hypothetical protein EBZ74_05960 [Planctomycetia bacterium]|nr:hypothetical protein [Planctomycetia bacterium]